MRTTMPAVYGLLLILGFGSLAGTSTGCGGDATGPGSEDICAQFWANTSGNLFFGPCGMIVGPGVSSASFECSSSPGGESWSGTVSVSRNTLGQVTAYSATVSGTSCTDCDLFSNVACSGEFSFST